MNLGIIWSQLSSTHLPLGLLVYSTQSAASSGVPVPRFTAIIGVQPEREPALSLLTKLDAAFIRRNRRDIRELVSRWTGEYQFTLDQVLKEMIGRCQELKLRAVGPESRLKLDFTILLTVHTTHYIYRRRTWHAV